MAGKAKRKARIKVCGGASMSHICVWWCRRVAYLDGCMARRHQRDDLQLQRTGLHHLFSAVLASSCSAVGRSRTFVVGLGTLSFLAHFTPTFPDFLPRICIECYAALKENQLSSSIAGAWL